MSTDEIEAEVDEFTVFVAIPVFNRIADTLQCIDCLKAQTFTRCKIIVVDGGSGDNTPSILRERHPDVIVLESETALWWGGATRMAIDWGLNASTSSSDFILMLNNDTLFDTHYLEALLGHSIAHNTAVCGVVVDIDDNSIIIDAGVSFDWEGYAFRGRYVRPEGETIDLNASVLPGRGTLIPIEAVRKAGNVDDKHFPHYLADYEFTYRLKRDGGIGMAVAYDISVQTKVDTIVVKRDEYPTLKEVRARIKARFGSRSKQNCIDHLWFIYLHAPWKCKIPLLFRIIFSNSKYVLQPIFIRLARNPAISAIVGIKRGAFGALGRVKRGVLGFVRRVKRLFIGPYLINATDVAELNLDFTTLVQSGILEKTKFDGYFFLARPQSEVKECYPEAVILFQWAASPGRKFRRFMGVRNLLGFR